ncbi:HalOD1 output domain-containing protein [Natrinema sp. 1APR25-10V2]|uniref:HalOD1 output domain-containing protein n=1 Tax=Natrinema sp. 1APR25-10V2 TaxID=2951081 RepID=UPI002876BADE|nr:HalOD1 output domain-containing protein [Natrinema sp. 1APR25-10V2]MDS0475367.1 hypothetical protein [Natrinema sp. 1APR25-10V2]
MSSDSDRRPLLEYDYDADTPPSVAVIRAIATLEEVDPTALSTKHGQTLFDRIDPSGFDTLVQKGTVSNDLVVEFTIYGYRIRIEEPTRVLVYGGGE